MTMVERVARVIYREFEDRPEYAQAQMNGIIAHECARAAIEAMRDIDSRALALILHDIDDLRGPMRESNSTFRTFWQAAIDHALNEEPAP